MRIRACSAVVAALGLAAGAPARAEEPERAAAVLAEGAVPGGWEVTPESQLADLHGGALLAATQQHAAVGGNRVGDGVQTGTVSLSDGAFAGSQGIFVSTLNTGNNVAIQTSLHVQIHLE